MTGSTRILQITILFAALTASGAAQTGLTGMLTEETMVDAAMAGESVATGRVADRRDETMMIGGEAAERSGWQGCWYTTAGASARPAMAGPVPPGNVGATMRLIPRPARHDAEILLDLPRSEYVQLRLMDHEGREMLILADGPREAGSFSISLPGEGLESGAYLIRLDRSDESISIPLLLVK